MYIVTVAFLVSADRVRDFHREMLANARASLANESGCRQFDVCVSGDDPARIFLYEAYDDRAAFDAHLATRHFASFNELTSGWVLRKDIQTFERLGP